MNNHNNDSRNLEAQLKYEHNKQMRRLFFSGITLAVAGGVMAWVAPHPHDYAGLIFNMIGLGFLACWILVRIDTEPRNRQSPVQRILWRLRRLRLLD